MLCVQNEQHNKVNGSTPFHTNDHIAYNGMNCQTQDSLNSDNLMTLNGAISSRSASTSLTMSQKNLEVRKNLNFLSKEDVTRLLPPYRPAPDYETVMRSHNYHLISQENDIFKAGVYITNVCCSYMEKYRKVL